MIFVQSLKNRYAGSSAAAAADAAGSGKATHPFIRRPTNGIQIKEDTFATIRVVAADSGGNKLLVDAGSKRKGADDKFMEINGKRATDIYSNFLLQQVQEDRVEKQQMLETFGEAYIFFFGQRARVISFQGVLANTFDFNWESEWWWNYENYLRGTKCVENDARVYISYDNTLVGGYIIGTSSSKDATNKNHVSFQFQLFVTYYSNFSAIGNPDSFSGDRELSGLSFGKHSVTGDFSESELAQYRPARVQDIPIQVGPLLGGQPTTLFSAMESNFAKAKDAWGQVDQVVNSTLTSVQGLFNADGGVRVPVGFAGSAVFNDEPTVATLNENSGRVNFTTFADNTGEYVGVGDHYGTTEWSLAKLSSFGVVTQDQELTYSQQMVDAARDLWAKGGKFVVPDVALGPVSKFLVSKSLGLLAVGATAAWQKANTALQPGSADAPFGNPLTALVNNPFLG